MDNESTLDSSATPPKPKQSSLYMVFKYVSIGTGILGIGFLIALGGFLLAQGNIQKTKNIDNAAQAQNSTAIVSPTTTPSVKDLASTIVDTQIPGQKLYASPRLGISFTFFDKSNGESIDAKEVGNKIYVYFAKYPYTQGQYVEVFDKNSSDALDQAIKKQILVNISSSDCFVKNGNADKAAKFPSTFEVKTLGFPVDPNSDLPAFAQSNKCPIPYAEANGISYFLGDTSHPLKFLFFSIGQFGIGADATGVVTWQDTIKFLD
jgi:hypothetical protein